MTVYRVAIMTFDGSPLTFSFANIYNVSRVSATLKTLGPSSDAGSVPW